MANMSDTLRKYVLETTEKIVDNPNEIDVNVTVSTKAVIIQLKVSDIDCGKVIGRNGRTIDALKILCLAIKNTQFPDDSRRVVLEVLEDENSHFNYK